jgi:LmbE family N-acetylglucosaminyl deacetylase
MLTNKEVLVIVAHPDDAESFCGGTIARLTRQGNTVRLIVCTTGDRGSHHREISPTSLTVLRKQEQEEARKILGITDIIWLDFADGELAKKPELRDRLIRLYRQLRPDVILTFDPWKHYEFHPDHRAVGFCATEARMLADLPWIYPELTMEGISPWHPAEMYLFSPEEPNYWVDIEPELERKIQARLAHCSQNDFIKTDLDREKFIQEIRSAAKQASVDPQIQFAEAFHKVDATDFTL